MIVRVLFLFSLFFLSLELEANIGVSPMVIDLIGKEADAEIAVKNLDNKYTAYVEVIPYFLSNPANLTAAKSRIRHPDKDGLLVFPAKLVLLPGQTQYVRLVKTAKALSSDKVYEVDFIPRLSTHLTGKNRLNGLTLGVRVIVGYGARITLRPDNPVPRLIIQRLKNQLVIKNSGNTALTITSCSQQTLQKREDIPLPAYTLFAGQIIKKQLKQSTPITLKVSCMGKPLGSFHTK